jgi:hypothetical protein
MIRMCNVASESLRLFQRAQGPNAAREIDKGGPFVPLIDVVMATWASHLSHRCVAFFAQLESD